MAVIGKNGSWIQIKHNIPFRNMYLYWDREVYLGDKEFVKEKVKVRFTKKRFENSKYPFVGVVITCWQRDAEKVENIMNEIDKKLRIIDSEYRKFLTSWHTHINY